MTSNQKNSLVITIEKFTVKLLLNAWSKQNVFLTLSPIISCFIVGNVCSARAALPLQRGNMNTQTETETGTKTADDEMELYLAVDVKETVEEGEDDWDD